MLVGPFALRTGDRQMTDSTMILTVKETKALYNLSTCFGDPDNMDMTEEELAGLEARLHKGPGASGDILTERMGEVARACTKLGPHRSARLDVIESGVRLVVLDTSALGTRARTLICPWTDVVMCRINPLLPLLDRALGDFDR